MLTLTIRHESGHSLHELIRGLNSAYRSLNGNAPWSRQKRRRGIIGSIRGFEITRGECGWHPHLHVLLFFERQISEVDRTDLEEWLQERWPRYVGSNAPEGTTPDRNHGVRLTYCHDGSYVAKMHLEITAPRGKQPKGGSRTPWDILHAWNIHGRNEDAALLREYESATRGINFVRWSRGLKKRFGIGEQEDSEIVQGQAEEQQVLALLGPALWRAVRRIPGAPIRVLESAEAGGGRAVEALLRKIAPNAPLVTTSEPDWTEGEGTAELWEDLTRGDKTG